MVKVVICFSDSRLNTLPDTFALESSLGFSTQRMDLLYRVRSGLGATHLLHR